LYRGVVAVTREADGSLALGGGGTPLDWLVEMTRFDQDSLFDRLAAEHHLDLTLMRDLAAAIARLHACARIRSDHGGRAGMSWVADGNALGLLLPRRRRRPSSRMPRVSTFGGAEGWCGSATAICISATSAC
jgi:hypothetical protein